MIQSLESGQFCIMLSKKAFSGSCLFILLFQLLLIFFWAKNAIRVSYTHKEIF